MTGNWQNDKCPVCGRTAILRFIRIEVTCGYHWWKWDEGKQIVLPPLVTPPNNGMQPTPDSCQLKQSEQAK